MEPDPLTKALAELLTEPYGRGVEIAELRREGGGASRVTCSFDAVTPEGTRHPLILRMAAPGVTAGGPLLREAAAMRAAAKAGVPTPELVAEGDADGPLGAEFVVMARIEGETIPRRVLRSPELAEARPLLAARCGQILAAIHRIPPGEVPGLEVGDQLDLWSGLLEATGLPHPALELTIRHLDRERPPQGESAVVHGDFRNGNLIIGPDGVRSVLDWELAHLGDPLEDLGWLCAKPWRFGSPMPVGGFGAYDQLIGAYESAAATRVDPGALRWWEMFALLKWAIICVMQTQRHLSGDERSIELAALGRRTAESEWDLLSMLP